MFAAVLANGVRRVVEAGIDGHGQYPSPIAFEFGLEPGHLLTAGDAPGSPEFKIDWRSAISLRKIDRRAVDRAQYSHGRVGSDQCPACFKGSPLPALGVGVGRLRNSCGVGVRGLLPAGGK